MSSVVKLGTLQYCDGTSVGKAPVYELFSASLQVVNPALGSITL